MNTSVILRIALPAAGLLAVGALVVQARGTVASCSEPRAVAAASRTPEPVKAEGRLAAYPGAEVKVGTDFAGTLRRVAVEERQRVRKGQLLATFVSDDLRAERDEALARFSEAGADLRLSEIEIERAERLVRDGVSAQQDLDRRLRDRDAAVARRATARAAVARLDAQIAKTRIVSPIDGVVVARHAHGGETLDRGSAIVTIADLGRVRVEAEVDEYDAGRVAPGAAVTVAAEGFDGSWTGRVEDIPDQVGARVLKPTDPGRPTDTRVLLVKVALDGPTPLKLGQRVEVAITRRGAQERVEERALVQSRGREEEAGR